MSNPLDTQVDTTVKVLARSDALVRRPPCSRSRGHPPSDETLEEAFETFQTGPTCSSVAGQLWSSYKCARERLDELRPRKDATDTAAAAVAAAVTAADLVAVELREKIAAVDVTATAASRKAAEVEAAAKVPTDSGHAIETVPSFMANCTWLSDTGRDCDSLRSKFNHTRLVVDDQQQVHKLIVDTSNNFALIEQIAGGDPRIASTAAGLRSAVILSGELALSLMAKATMPYHAYRHGWRYVALMRAGRTQEFETVERQKESDISWRRRHLGTPNK
jgi:hypothetical protein